MTLTHTTTLPQGVELKASLQAGFEEILTEKALGLVAGLHRHLNSRRKELLEERKRYHQRLENGEMPGFISETLSIRQGDWTVAPIPED